MKNRSSNIFSFLLFICVSFLSYSQNDEGFTLLEDSDDDRIKFEGHFFEALKYKSIGNYSRAITELENCQQFSQGYASVQFEFSKNYYYLKKYNEADYYIGIALSSEPDNYWFLKMAKNVYVKQNQLERAIAVQQDLIKLKPAEKEDLVLLYIMANDREKAQALIDELTSKGRSSSKLRNYQKAIEKYRKKTINEEPKADNSVSIQELKKSFKIKKEYLVLKKILEFELTTGNAKDFKHYSNEGVELFPAQPFVYLMKGSYLNTNKEYKEAIDVLITGLDFIVDDRDLEADFFDQLAISYNGLNQLEKSKEFRDKALKYRSTKD